MLEIEMEVTRKTNAIDKIRSTIMYVEMEKARETERKNH